MRRPIIGLHVGTTTPDVLRPLARELSRWVDLRVPESQHDPKGHLVVAPQPVPDQQLAETAYLLHGDAEPPPRGPVGAVLVEWQHADAAPLGAIAVPPTVGAAATRRCVPPAIRARWRRRAGLPERFTVRAGHRDAAYDTLLDTALAVAAAVWATGPTAEVALALGAPLLTDAATAARYRLRDGIDVMVVDDADIDPALAALAADEHLAARLSREGRAAAERCDLRSVARRLTIELGWVERSEPVHRLLARLDELGTPEDAGVRSRAVGMEASLSVGGHG